jgi:tetratricopeptide (TPR) repeat protein
MSKKHDKMMADLNRLAKSKDFQSEEELFKFLDSLVGKEIPTLNAEPNNNSERAEDLVFEAHEMTPIKARKNIEKALELDRDCIEAYEFLGTMETSPEIASVFYEKGISIGKRNFGGKYLKEYKGMFWGMHETRPFMRCMHSYSDCLYAMGEIDKAVSILEEMIELNPNDNQGVRDQLLLYLIELNENKKFLKYEKMFEEDGLAFALFNRALFAFKTLGDCQSSELKLQKALNQNKFVAKALLSKKPIPELPHYYGYGDQNEANYYVNYAYGVWIKTDGALEWLKKYAKK